MIALPNPDTKNEKCYISVRDTIHTMQNKRDEMQEMDAFYSQAKPAASLQQAY